MSWGKTYNIYIMASATGVIYIGITSNLIGRIWEHKNGVYDGFTKKYHCHKLVYYEVYDDVNMAINREKELKSWRRSKKTASLVIPQLLFFFDVCPVRAGFLGMTISFFNYGIYSKNQNLPSLSRRLFIL